MLYQLSYASSQWENPAALPQERSAFEQDRDARARVRREFHFSMGPRPVAKARQTRPGQPGGGKRRGIGDTEAACRDALGFFYSA